MLTAGIVSLTAIIALAFLGWCDLEHGIDGTVMLLIVAAISGIAGYNANKILNVIKGNKQ